MRVLFVSPLGSVGGSERSLIDLIASIRDTVPDVQANLLLLQAGELEQAVAREGVPVSIEPLPEPLARLGESATNGMGVRQGLDFIRALGSLPSYIARLRARVRSFAPDLVHTNGMKAHALAAVAFAPTPLVIHLRDFPSQRPISRRLLPLLARRRAIVVANSRAVAADAESLTRALRTRVVYNGIDTRYFAPAARDPDYLAGLAGLGPPGAETLNIGMVATYAWWKGQALFLDAAARVAAAAPGADLRFYIVGGPIYATRGSELDPADLRRSMQQLGLDRRAGLVPFQADVARVYRALDIVVHPSTRPEPFGRTIVEAMASGRPVIVSRAGGAEELFREAETGLGFTPNDPADLARAIAALVNDPALRERLALAGRRHALEAFDRARLGGQLRAVYDELLLERA